MINIRTNREIEILKKAGKIVAAAHQMIEKFITPGVKTIELDQKINSFIEKNGAKSIIKDYEGFPSNTCISINECVVHGIPNQYMLKSGDIISIDISIQYHGYVADSAWTYRVGKITISDEHLLTATNQALIRGIEKVRPNAFVSDISHAIEVYAKLNRLGIVKELAGHGVGTNLHEEPMIPNYGKPNRGAVLKKGMVLAIEPMLTKGKPKITILNDGWSVVTNDRKNSAHFEHTVLVTGTGYEILTLNDKS